MSTGLKQTRDWGRQSGSLTQDPLFIQIRPSRLLGAEILSSTGLSPSISEFHRLLLTVRAQMTQNRIVTVLDGSRAKLMSPGVLSA